MLTNEPSPEHLNPPAADSVVAETRSGRREERRRTSDSAFRAPSHESPLNYRVQLAPVVHAAVVAPAEFLPADRASWSESLAFQARVWRRQWRYRLRTPWTYKTDWPLAAPLALIAGLTLVCRWANLDLAISRWFYDPAAREWPWLFSLPCTAFYRLGIYPPFLLAVSGCFLLFGGHLFEPTGTLRRAGLFLVLLMVLGPGLIVNVGFKEFWGRPRPNQIAEFGGEFRHSEVGSPGNLPHGNSSFPSGHASIAFYMMAPGFLVSKRRPQLAAQLLLGGTLFGLCMSASRVIQGAHFASDVVWGGAIVYFAGVALSRLILKPRSFRRLYEPAISDRR